MATAGDGIAPSESGGGAREKFENSTSTGKSSDQAEKATTGISELEQTLKQLTFTRSKIQHPATTMENLPDELLINIFIRLLAKQLAQMRSVSKCWNALLSHPSFVKSHLHRSIRNNNQQILLVFHNYHQPFTQYSCKSPHIEPTSFIKHTQTNLPKKVIGSVNGLICLSKAFYFDIHIWNPSLSAVSAIPPPHSVTDFLPFMNYMRFGFDPKADDYKLVKLTGTLDIFSSIKEWLPVEVYSMRKRSWKFITQPFPSHIIGINNPDELCVDGHDGYLHWQIKTVVKTEETIVAFDLRSETFREIPLPDAILDSNHGMHQLGVLGGKLCEMSWRKDGACEVWVMEEYGVPESWATRHVFSHFTTRDWRFTYGFTSCNELLLGDKDGRLILYDPVANKTKKTRTKQKVMKIVEYVDSLVWI